MAGERKPQKRNTRTREKRAQDAAKAAKMRLEAKVAGKKLTVREVASELGISHSQVVRDLQHLVREALANGVIDTQRYINRALAELEWMRDETRGAWEKSKANAETHITEEGGRDGVKITERIVGQCGDPRFHQVLIAIQEREAKLLALDRPAQKGEDGGGGSGPTLPGESPARAGGISLTLQLLEGAARGGPVAPSEAPV